MEWFASECVCLRVSGFLAGSLSVYGFMCLLQTTGSSIAGMTYILTMQERSCICGSYRYTENEHYSVYN